MGRAYYAAFGHARTFAESEGFISLETSEDHGLLRLHFERTRRDDIARLLGDLRKWRNEADYRGSVPNLEMLARESIARADRIVRRLTEV
ncbi:MAG TPA: hypothetical protein VFC78_01575 [Tepidisphaeraceae bacterium]|nr:hypothetical protein [Tepidisphaeraceae bacterium]